ncbi:potassium-transporting ATPase subunit KdpC [Acidithiobacillus sp. IBUN Pt1247-S3]|uniref:potassium-transporting ATPase subunit KdpC n=1 Tax=Acidithiobacillus sp. IBUN Pt1247-S3 TaxID=3166642 RepID=UPI0034E4A816
MLQSFRQAISIFILLGLCVGVAYPMLMTGISSLVFPWQAHGSLLREQGKVVGSQEIGQYFTSPQYFWGRPSATDPVPYDAASSGASNLGPSNPVLFRHIAKRVAYLRRMDPTEGNRPVPVDLVTSSFSGLDPDISIAAAQYQIARVAAAGHLPLGTVQNLVRANTHWPLIPFIGEPVVSVLPLNLGLEKLYIIKNNRP